MRIKNTEQNSLRPQTGASTLSSPNKALIQLRQKSILKVGVAKTIKSLITMDLGKNWLQLKYCVTKWTFQTRLETLWWVLNILETLWWVLNIGEHQLKHVYQMLAFLQKSFHQRYTSWWQLVMIIYSNCIKTIGYVMTK